MINGSYLQIATLAIWVSVTSDLLFRSTCSNQELNQFMASHPQAICLEDVQQPQARYDYAKGGISPGEKYNALAQCQLAFGNEFKPHLKDEVPFEVRC